MRLLHTLTFSTITQFIKSWYFCSLQSFKKYLRLTLVFMRNSTLWEKFRKDKKDRKKKAYFYFYHFFILLIILKFWNYLQNKEMIKTEKKAFFFVSYTNVLYDFLFIQWYQFKWTRETQPFSWPIFLKLKWGWKKLRSTWNQAGERCILFIYCTLWIALDLAKQKFQNCFYSEPS